MLCSDALSTACLYDIFQVAILGSMFAGPIALAVVSGVTLVTGYIYILPKDLANLSMGATPDVLMPTIVQILLQRFTLTLQGINLGQIIASAPSSDDKNTTQDSELPVSITAAE
ncbi:hypothetical protein CYMTET_51966 [Cymbomonas tetramitiformis]|uniref:Uncharacterized protein n=1 Tax=Cymbomonas tetramitiformis TaxID=36881 RepID=A0AAE0BJY5_9CHLO|nr:hypothetical protein CYMTET_51966 [Cymbomonas tetramitiformis]